MILDELFKPRPWISHRYLINIPTGKAYFADKEGR